MVANRTDVEKRLWDATDQLHWNSGLRSSEYSTPPGALFHRYADHKFTVAERELAGASTGRRVIGKADYQARGVLYLPDEARFSKLLELPEGANIGKAVNDAMRASVGPFDFAMANPPFNVDGVDKDRLKDDRRFPFDRPRTGSANLPLVPRRSIAHLDCRADSREEAAQDMSAKQSSNSQATSLGGRVARS